MPKIAPHSASEIAKYFIWKSAQEGRPITNKKLQKLVYYAQAWYLVAKKGEEKLYPDKIEAWIHGPVIPNVYHSFKHFGFAPIDPSLGDKNSFSDDINHLLNEVWETYGELDASTLESLTHSELPWREARKNVEVDELSDTEIDPHIMTDFYSAMFNTA